MKHTTHIFWDTAVQIVKGCFMALGVMIVMLSFAAVLAPIACALAPACS
jgi:RsiW-degrading membrane proteinase PrsW (M82 family)